MRLVNSIVFQVAEERASDIHVEPQENALVVRYRIDGVSASRTTFRSGSPPA